MKRACTWGTLLVAALVIAQSATAAESREKVNAELSKPTVRGALVYRAYCSGCHGETGDGSARATKLYGVARLKIGTMSRADSEEIVLAGGEALGKSPYMPPWRDELSGEQIADVVTYLMVINNPVFRGQAVFKTRCILCHGTQGDGKGRASHLYNPPPADLTRSDKNDQYKEMIITLGGEAMGRSPNMPVWGQQLTPQEIKDIVVYLRTLLVLPPPPGT